MTNTKMDLRRRGSLMHRMAILLSLSLMLSAVSAFAGPPPAMRWSFTGPSALPTTANGEDWFYGVVPLTDGSYLAVGYTELAGQSKISAVIAHVSAAKALLKEVTFSDPGGAVLFDITETPTGYVAVGSAGGAVLAVGIDLNLQNLQDQNVPPWQKLTAASLTPATPSEGLEAHSVRPVPSGGVIVTGWRSNSTGSDGSLLLRLDANQVPILSAFPGGTGATVIDANIQAKAHSVRVESDMNGDHFILAGGARPVASDPGDIYVRKVKADATPEWLVTRSKAQLTTLGYVETIRTPLCPGQLAQTLWEEADTAELIPSSAGGGYMVSAQVNLLPVWNPMPSCLNPAITPSYIDMDAGLLRISPAGLPLWAKQIGRFSGIDFQTPLRVQDDGVVVVGNDATDLSHVKISVIKADFSGTQTWQGTYIVSGDTNDCVFGAAVTPDGSIVVAGNNNLHDDDYLLAKIGPARDLWMRDEVADAGDEPDLSTGPMWESPEIWVRTFQDFFPWPNAHQHENPEYRDPTLQVPNYVYAEVRNRGVEPASGVVHFYYAKASTGLAWKSSWDGSQFCCPGKGPCSGELSSVTITGLLPNTTQIVSIPWFPPNPADFATCGLAQEQGHYCLLARIETSSTSSTLGMAFKEGSDVNANTAANNNIVWKNVTVVDNFPGVGKTSKHYALVHNVEHKPAAVTLVFKVPSEEKREPIFNFSRIEILLSPTLTQRWIAGGRKAKGVTVSGGILRITGTDAELQNILLAADQQESFGILLRPQEPQRLPAPGNVSLDVVQVQGGKTVGGVRFTVRTTPPVKPQTGPLPAPGPGGFQPGQIDPRDPLHRPGEPGWQPPVTISNLPMQGGNEKTPCPALGVIFKRSDAASIPYLGIMLPNLDQQCGSKGPWLRVATVKFLKCAPDPRGKGFGPNASADITCAK
jgi:hypothetical protein